MTTTLGTLPTNETQRDAIHVAIIPMEAAEKLYPGQDVGITSSGRASAKSTSLVGIVDPFLKQPIYEGGKFYLVLYPNTVTGMRHEWSHPAFDGPFETANPQKQEAEKWLRNYATKIHIYDGPEAAFKRLLNGLSTNYIVTNGTDLHSIDELNDQEELKKYGEIYLGIEIDFNNFEFSCSC